MLRTDKAKLVAEVAEKLKAAQSVILADYKGLTVAEITDLRGRLRAGEVEFRVIKNRLGKLALAEAKLDTLDDLLHGNTAWAFGVKDAVDPARILAEFAKDNEKLSLKGGLLEGEPIDEATVKSLASMPSRVQLLSRMAGGLKQPAVKMVTAMEASVVKIARAFQALADKKAEAEGA